jgi:tripartite-type tricarboxylate transporter receptor subunit TctC
VLPFGQVSPHRISAAKGQDEVNEAKPCSVISGARSNKVKIADHLGVAAGELEYVPAIRHDVSWVVQLRRSEMNRAFFGSALATLLFAGQAPAQPYPSRPVTFIVPYGAGGPVDTLARLLSEPMRTSLGQPVIVENVTGANGTIGVARAVRAAPDGYTVSIGNWPSHVVNGAIYTLPYDIRTDFEPVARLPSNPYVVVARKDLPATDLKGLVAWLRANPDKATEGTAGPGSGQHVSGIYFQEVTKTRFQFVPYRAGSAEIMRDLVAGHIDLTFDQAITALPHVRNGGVKAYAVTSNKRLAAAPDIPTVDEAGAPGVYISTWYGLWVPKGTSPEAIRKLTIAAMDALADPTVRQRLTDLGQEIPPPEQQTAEALAAHQKAEIEKWWPLIKAANIKAD